MECQVKRTMNLESVKLEEVEEQGHKKDRWVLECKGFESLINQGKEKFHGSKFLVVLLVVFL